MDCLSSTSNLHLLPRIFSLIMHLIISYGTFSLLAHLTTSLTLNLPQPQNLGIVLHPANNSSLPSALQISPVTSPHGPPQTPNASSSLTPTKLTGQEVYCDRITYGSPHIASCVDAFAQIPQVASDPTYTFGPRGTGNYDIGLPWRYISCKSCVCGRRGVRCEQMNVSS